MRLATTALLLAATALTACSGTTTGSGIGSAPGAAPKKSGFDTSSDSDCDGSASCGGKLPSAGSGVEFVDAGGPPVPSEYDPLFTQPASASVTSNSLVGVWAGSMAFTNDDVRLVITASSITMAVRCGSGGSGGQIQTIGLTVSAVTSDTSIRVLESTSIGSNNCRIIVHPQTFARCSTGSGASMCFDLTDSGLDFGPWELFTGDGNNEPNPAFSKMSDGS